MTAPKRHPKNAPGPFYVMNDSCLRCGAPEVEAPTLMGSCEDEDGCYFRRQPETPDDVYTAIHATVVSCVEVLRYGGTDPDILRRLAEAGMPDACDHPLAGCARVVRDHVRFTLSGPTDAQSLAMLVVDWLRARYGAIDLSGAAADNHGGARFAYLPPSPPQLHCPRREVTIRKLGARQWLAHGELYGFHELLLANGADGLRWFSRREWESGATGQAWPY